MKISTFSERINEEMKVFITLPKDRKKRSILEKRILAGILGEPIPDNYGPLEKETKRFLYLRTLHNRYFEIKESLERIKSSLIFITNMSVPKKLTKIQYIRYHHEFYLNAMYIYYLRIDILLNFLIKRSRKLNLTKEIEEVDSIAKIFKGAMQGIITTRGLHVHKEHYSNKKLDQVYLLHTMSSDFVFLNTLKEVEFRKLRKKIKIEIQNNINVIDNFFEKDLYHRLENLIFNKLLPEQE